ncbi:MAG: hypothetical protein U0L92_03685 [Clostridia bacterium]|nr:hypothetical protein [Clostridia bacterium]
MQLMKVIEMADMFCPNPYTLEEKLRWCDEVTASIRRDIKKVYTTIETTVSSPEDIQLPDNLSFEDVEVAYLNGQPMDKLDFRSFLVGQTAVAAPGKLKLVFLEQPYPVRNITIQGEFDLSENFIKIPEPPFAAGDTLEWVALESPEDTPDWSQAGICYVLDAVYDGIMVGEDTFTPQTAAPLALRRVIDDHTEVDEAPYDGMYVEYLLAKMALYDHDYTAYGAHMAQYNTLYDVLRRNYKARSTLNPLSRFRRYW